MKAAPNQDAAPPPTTNKGAGFPKPPEGREPTQEIGTNQPKQIKHGSHILDALTTSHAHAAVQKSTSNVGADLHG